MSASRPPELARALLEWMLPPSDAGAATGDLDEEYARFVRPERGRLAADLWYWRQVLLSVPRLVGRRTRVGGAGGEFGQAVRVLRRRSGFTLATVATLGLALGASTAVFGVLHSVLLRPLPYEEPERLVRPIPDELFFVDVHSAQAFADRMTTLESTAAWSRTLLLFTGDGTSEEVRGASVSWNHFDLLGTAPMIGRGFTREDAAGQDGVVLGHGLWVRRFGADPGVVGRSVEVAGRSVTVLGVMGPEHVPLEFDWEAWWPMPLEPEAMEGRGMVVNGRLRDGVTLEQSREEMRMVLGDIWVEQGDELTEEDRAGLAMTTLPEWLLGDVRPALWTVAAGVAFLLLLACANVGHLMLAQSDSRSREFAVRAALGAGKVRVGRQLVLETLILSALGGAAGLAVAAGSLEWLVSQLPADLPRRGQIALGGGSFAFLSVAVPVTALFVGALPILRAAGRIGQSLSGGHGSTGGPRGVRFRAGLVATETALAVVLVVGAGLMMRSLAALHAVDPGFEAAGLVAVRPTPPADRYPVGPELEEYYRRLGEELERLPGVSSVGAVQFLPMTPGGWWSSYVTEADAADPEATTGATAMRVVREGYLETMRTPLVQGRSFGPEDFRDAPTAVLVNQAWVREADAGDPVGATVYFGGERTPARVLGVVRDVRQNDLRTASHPEVYLPFRHAPWRRMWVVARVDDEPAALASIRDAVLGLDAEVSMNGPEAMRDIVARTTGRTRLLTTLMTLFGAIGLALGAVGIYGVAAQAMGERRREIGIRMALGAESGAITWWMVARGMVPVALGVAVGLGGVLGVGRFTRSLLFEVSATDPASLLGAPAVLLVVALGALSIPAVRAGRMDPVRTLREE